MTAMLTMISTPTVIVMCDIHDDLAIDNKMTIVMMTMVMKMVMMRMLEVLIKALAGAYISASHRPGSLGGWWGGPPWWATVGGPPDPTRKPLTNEKPTASGKAATDEKAATKKEQ